MKKYQAAMAEANLSPMMRQYCETHAAYDDYLLLYRLGDFYELFFDDAEIVARELELVLTGRDAGLKERVPMCGMPYHAVDNYINRLLAKGYKLAVCDQMEDPALAKGLVKREITRLVTPGTQTDSETMAADRNNWLLACYQQQKYYGLAVLELVSGRFMACQINFGCTETGIINELINYHAGEYLLPEKMQNSTIAQLLLQNGATVNYCADGDYNALKKDYLPANFNLTALSDNLISSAPLAYKAVIALLNYILQTRHTLPPHLQKIEYYQPQNYLQIDADSQNNLELFRTLREQKQRGSLIWAINQTKSSMGLRLLKLWLQRPLIDVESIVRRQEAVTELLADYRRRQKLRELIGQIYDIERLAGKLGNGNLQAKDLLAIKDSLLLLQPIKDLLQNCKCELLQKLVGNLRILPQITSLLERAINPDCSNNLKEGNIIAAGYNQEIDYLRDLQSNSQKWFDDYVITEKQKNGIKNLKIGFNRLYGYYLEVSKLNSTAVPDYYIRKQTLVNYERFITPELKDKENEILGAQAKLYTLESALFQDIRSQVRAELAAYQVDADIISTLDVLQSLAEQAQLANYCQPHFQKGKTLELKDSRHPVLEKLAGQGNFVANDCQMDCNNTFCLITGPNMAGKSTYMRQVALICLLAQIGSYVPAAACTLSPVDRIFTRIGASDDLGLGKSTFMVEMQETARIMLNLTSASLLILDEIGRGTGTADGLALAWSICEALNDTEGAQPRTLFATHYHELINLAKHFSTIRNYHVTVAENADSIEFLHKLKAGGTDQSYGIEVAKLAGLPDRIIERANDIMLELIKQNYHAGKLSIPKYRAPLAKQLQMFSPQSEAKDALLQTLRDTDINTLSPLDALHTLNELIEKAKELKA